MRNLLKVILLITTLAFISHSLHLHDASSKYIDYLQGQQTSVKGKLDALIQKLSDNYKAVEKQNDIDKKISLLEEYLKEQRLLLAQINLETVDQQLNTSEWVCPILSDQKKKQIQSNLDGINQDLQVINKVLSPLDESEIGPGINKAKQQLKDTQKTSDNLKSALVSTGTQINPSQIHPDIKSNLNAQNWVLDGKKIDELNQEYKKAAESGSLQICPIDKPFYSTKTQQCISCDGQKQFFSLRTSQCIKCYNFDISQHRCKDNQGSATNILSSTENKIIVPEGKKLDDYKKTPGTGTPCPQNAPFYTGSECIQCDNFFDIEAKACKNCDGKNHYDSKTHTCKMQEVTVTNVDAGKIGLIIPNDKSIEDLVKDNKKLQEDNKVIPCPSSKPYFNDFECVSCAQGTLFSILKKSCGTCEAGTFFNKDSNHCENKSYYSNLDDPNWSSKNTYEQIQKDLSQKAKDPLYEKCPVDKPFSTGKDCIQCGDDEHFDLDKKQCTKCFNGQFFNKNLHNCTYTQSNFQTNPQKAPNLIFEGRPKNEWMYYYYQNIENNDGMTDCPSQKPYFDGVSCIICPEEHPYFNLEYKMCQKCSEGTKYDINHHECLTTAGNIATQVPTLEKMAAGIFS